MKPIVQALFRILLCYLLSCHWQKKINTKLNINRYSSLGNGEGVGYFQTILQPTAVVRGEDIVDDSSRIISSSSNLLEFE